ncbi:MAG: chromosomal replication initiator protein DnaA [Thermoflexaceae bacterium]|nr:chromosomal replication initiator protein DnaA [Thermoflexaceae bacterium]
MLELIKEKWEYILETMKKEYDISDVSFKTWILPLKVYSFDNNIVTILVSEQPMGLDYIKKRYLTPLQVTISEVIGVEVSVEFILPNDAQKTVKKDEVSSYNNGIPKSNLNPKYTFDTFVVGNNNNFAHAACLAVAESPAEVYNPLFIYGGVGLGKTHLMQSIAHFVQENSPQLKVKYVTSEEFTNELIESLKNQKLTNSEFREKYRNVDVLLIDDIQFIIGKESTQEEFFHTFNTLYGSNKQIIISSDKPPKEMETLEERLRTRFECGLTVDIQMPTYETSMAILDKKIEAEGYFVPFEVKDFIVNNINSNIRELEGALNKITAYSKVAKTEITLDLAKNLLKDLITPNAHREITIEYIIQVVADHFGITIADIISAKRKSEIVYPRQIAMYLCRKCTAEPLTSIGKYMGDRDHTTVIHGAEKIERELTYNENTKNVIDVLIKKINPS